MTLFQAMVEEHGFYNFMPMKFTSDDSRLTVWNAGLFPVNFPPARLLVGRQFKKAVLEELFGQVCGRRLFKKRFNHSSKLREFLGASSWTTWCHA